MKKFNNPLRRLLDRAQRKFVRTRPGSVLILVVALLVLMAIIGTAYMSMAQADRATAASHTNNTEIDLLLDGVVNMLKGVVVNDLYAGNGQFRDGQQSLAGAGYSNWSGLGLDSSAIIDPAQNAGNPWIGDRYPDVNNRTIAPSIRTQMNEPYWPVITAPLATSQFTSPYWNPAQQIFLTGQTTADPYHYSQRDSIRQGLKNRLMPGYITFNGQSYPAWVDNTHADPDSTFAILAADTDGDGVADAGYFKLPVGTINGVTYYAAVRIIDNTAAVNANTATWPNATTSDTTPSLYGDYFPTSINLLRMLNPNDSLTANTAFNQAPAATLINYRLNGATLVGPPIDDLGTSRADFGFVPDPLSTPGTIPGLDAFWMQLGRRLDNPAYAVSPTSSLNPLYQPLSVNESVYLAHNFILRDPNIITASASPSVLERALPQTLLGNSPAAPYTADAAYDSSARWFFQNFAFYSNNPTDKLGPDQTTLSPSPAAPARSLLVARNPVTNYAPNKFNPPISINGVPNSSPTVGFGDEVQLNGRAYVYIGPPLLPAQQLYIGSAASPIFQPAPTLLNPAHNTSLFWVAEPWANEPTKVSVNTANFGQLYTAYWSAMVDYSNRDALGFPRLDGSLPPAGAVGTELRQFYNPLRDPTLGTHGSPALPIADTEVHPVQGGVAGRLARRWSDVHSLQSSQRARIPTSEVLKLRAALAAVNTLALRNPEDPTLPTATVLLSGYIVEPTTSTQVPTNIEATVFGSKPQPYIVQVYAENDNQTKPTGVPTPNPQGYVGVELYNPYPFPINLTGCQLGIIAGRDLTPAGSGPAYPNMKVLPLANTSYTPPPGGLQTAGTNVPIVPAFGYLVLENFPQTAAALNATSDAVYRPPLVDAPAVTGTGGLAYYYVPNLSMVMRDPANLAIQPGGELVLLRPRQATLNAVTGLTFTPTIGSGYNELAFLYDMAPMDSFDFTGLNLTADPTMMSGIYYHRANIAGTQPNWKFVYPGRWDPSQPWQATVGTPPYRQEGTTSASWNASTGGTDTTTFTPIAAIYQPKPWGTVQTIPTYVNNFPAIQVASWSNAAAIVGMPGPFLIGASNNEFPFTGFPRNGDILQVPYFGAYRLRAIAGYDVNGNIIFPTTSVVHTADMFLELNPLTLDSQQTDDYDSYPPSALPLCDDAVENIGRFCPIDGKDVPGAPVVPNPPSSLPAFTMDDFGANPNLNLNPPYWRYHWAMQLLDYLTVQSPQDEQFPNAPPEAYLKFASALSPANVPVPVLHSTGLSAGAQTYGLVVASPTTINMTAQIGLLGGPTAAPGLYSGKVIQFLTGPDAGILTQIGVPTIGGQPNQWNISFPTLPVPPIVGDTFVIYGPVEPTASLNGLVNVNSASWRVLAAVPMVNNTMTAPARALINTEIAISIVRYRDYDDSTNVGHGHGPFKTLFELSRVPIYDFTGNFLFYFRDALGGPNSARTTAFTDAAGDITPYPNPLGNPLTVGDFEGTYLMMNRISNLLTTRSDSFTAYILLQGWQGAEGPNPTLVVQRRAAYIIDRTGVNSTNSTPTLTPIPTN